MSTATTLRQSGGSITLSIPETIARAMAVEAGSSVELWMEGRTLWVTSARRTLADRLAQSPKSPANWPRDAASLDGSPAGRELL